MPPPSKRGARGGIGPRKRNTPISRRFLPPLRCVAAAKLHRGDRPDGPGSPWGLPCRTTMAHRRHTSKSPGSAAAHAPASSRCSFASSSPGPCNLASHLVMNLAEYSAPALSSPRQRQRKRLRKLPIFTSFFGEPASALVRRSCNLRAFKKTSLLRAQAMADPTPICHLFTHLAHESAYRHHSFRGKPQKNSPIHQNFPSSQVIEPQRLSVTTPPVRPLQTKIFAAPTRKTVASPYFLGRVGREWRLVCHANGVLIRVDWAAKEQVAPRVVKTTLPACCL